MLLAVFLVSCNLQKRESSDLEDKLRYCEKELAFIVSDGDGAIKVNIDTIDGSKTVCDFVKEYYDLNKRRASFAFSYTHNRDTCYIGGGGDGYILCVFRGFCDSRDNLLAYSSSYYHSITLCFYVVSPGIFFDYRTVDTVMPEEMDFKLNSEIKHKSMYKITLLDEVSIQALCNLLSTTVNAYISSLNKYSEEKYVKNLCSLDSTEYNVWGSPAIFGSKGERVVPLFFS